MLAARPGPRSAGLALALLVVLATYFLTGPLLRPVVHPYNYSDFATFHSAARCFAEHRDPYDADSLRAAGQPSFGGWIGRYFYPPPFAALCVRPLLRVPFDAARRLWVLFEAGCYLGALGVLASLFPGSWPWAWRFAAVGSLGLAYAPIDLDLKLGSVSGLLLLLVALFLHGRRRGRQTLAAVALAAAVLLKLGPALVVVYLCLRGESRLALRTVLAGVALAVVALPWSGIGAWADYVIRVLPYLATANFSWFTNQSLDAFWWRILVPNPDTTPWIASPALHRVASIATSGMLIAGLAVVAWRRRRLGPSTASDAELGLVLVASLLLARVTWEYMLVLALPCFAVWLGWIATSSMPSSVSVVAALAYALCALPFPYTEAPLRSGIGLLFESPRTYGLLLLFGLTWQRLARPDSSQENEALG